MADFRRDVEFACIVPRWPHLNTTFILDELRGLEELGYKVVVLPLRRPIYAYEELHARYLELDAEVVWLSLSRVLIGSALRLVRSPKVLCRVLLELLWASRKSASGLAKAIIQFPRIAALATEIEGRPEAWVHAHFSSGPATAAWVLHELTGRRYSFTVHAFDVFAGERGRLANPALQLKADDAEFIVAEADSVAARVTERLGQDIARRVAVIPNGIPVDLFASDSGQRLSGPDLKILSVGTFTEKKGHEWLIRALREVIDSGISARLTIVGPGDRTACQELAVSLGVSDRVDLRGPEEHSQLRLRYHNADLFCLASVEAESGDMDGQPTVIKEAMAAGLPILSTSTSGIPELVRERETGFIVPPRDSQALAKAIAVLAQDERLRTRLGATAAEQVRSRFDYRQTSASLAAIISSKLARSQPIVRAAPNAAPHK